MKLRLKFGIFAVFLAFLGVSTAWGDTPEYNAALTAKVAQTGGGRVYASTSAQAGSDSSYTSATAGSTASGTAGTSGGNVMLYAHEKPDNGYRFLGWSDSAAVGSAIVSSEQHYGKNYKASTTDKGTEEYTLYAHFMKEERYTKYIDAGQTVQLTEAFSGITEVSNSNPNAVTVTQNGDQVSVTGVAPGDSYVTVKTPTCEYFYVITARPTQPTALTLHVGDTVKFNYDLGDNEALYAQYQVYDGATVSADAAPQGATSGNFARGACLTLSVLQEGTQQVDFKVLRSGGNFETYETFSVTVLPARLYNAGDEDDFTCVGSQYLSGQGSASWSALTQSPAGIVMASYSGQTAAAAGVHFVGAANGTTVVTAKNVTGSNGNLKGVEYSLKAAVVEPHEVTLAEGDNVQIWYNNTARKTWSLILNGTTYAAGVTGQGNGFDAVVKTGSEGGGTALQSYIDITAKGAAAESDLIIVTDGDNYYAYLFTCEGERVIKVGDTAQVTCRTVSTFDWQAQPEAGSEDYLSATCPPRDSGDTHGSTVTITGLEPTGAAPAYVKMHNEHFDATEVNAQGAIYKLACKVVGGPIIQVHLSAGAFIWTANGYWVGTNATYAVTVGDWSGAKPADKSQAGYNRYNPDSFTWDWHGDGASGKAVKLELNAKPGATKGDYAVFTVWAGDEKVVTYLVNVTTTFENMIAVGETAEGFLYGAAEPWVSQSSAPDICETEPTLYHNLYSSKAIPKRAGDVIICSTNPVTKADYWGILLKPFERHEREIVLAPGDPLDVTLPTNVYDPPLTSSWSVATAPAGKVSAQLTTGTEADATGATVHLIAGSAEGPDTVVVCNTYYVETLKIYVADPNKDIVRIPGKFQVQVGSTTNIVISGATGAWTAQTEHTDIVNAPASGAAGETLVVRGLSAGESVTSVSTADKIFIFTVEVLRKTGDLPRIVLWIDQDGKGQQLVTNLVGKVPDGQSTSVTAVRSDDKMIVDAMAMSGAYTLMAKQEGSTWLHVQTADTEYLQEVVVKLNHIDKRGIRLVVGKNGTKSTLSESFYQIISYSNTANCVTVSQLGKTITITPAGGTGHDEVFVECYQADYPDFPVTVHYWIDIDQLPEEEIWEFGDGYVAYRDVSEIYEDGNALVMTFTNINAAGQFRIPEGLTARVDLLAVGGGGGGGSVFGGLGSWGGGGGGAGGYSSVTNKKFQSGSFGVIVGEGGKSSDTRQLQQSLPGGAGGDSVLTNGFGYVFVLANGGGGGGAPSAVAYNGREGASGGGGAWNGTEPGMGGAGLAGQGTNGGQPTEYRCGAGGGGAAGAGGGDQTGGEGESSAISGTDVLYSQGGDGGRYDIVAVGQPGTGFGFGGQGGSCAPGGDGADGAVVVRITKLFKNILVPIPTTNDFITTLRAEWTDGLDIVPFPYEERQFRSPTDMELRYWAEAIDKVVGSNLVHCAYGGDGGTNKVGVGYYSFKIYLKDGYAWDDGTQYGSTEFLRYNWVVTEDLSNVDAHITVSKTVIWDDKSPDAIVRVDTATSPEMTGVKTPRVLMLGTLCSTHGLTTSVIADSINAITETADVDYYFYKNSTCQYTASLKQGQTVRASNFSVGSNAHFAMLAFYRRLYEDLCGANPKPYDYIVFEFDGSRLGKYYNGSYNGESFPQFGNEAAVATALKPFYEEGKVIWIVDNAQERGQSEKFSPYWRPNTYYYSAGNGTLNDIQYHALVGLFDPACYDKGTTAAQISTDYTGSGTRYYANTRNENQAYYNNPGEVTDLLRSVIKVKPYDIAFADKIMSPASGLTISSVTVQGCTNAVNGKASTDASDWYDIITWMPGDPSSATPEGVYGTVTKHSENFELLGFTDAVMSVTTNNEVAVDMSNCTARVWTRFDTHVHDDGTFCTSDNAEYNQQTGKFEKNPNDGRAKVSVTMGGGQQGMDIDGDAETSIPWRFALSTVNGHVMEVSGIQGGYVLVNGEDVTSKGFKSGTDVSVYYLGKGGYRLVALRDRSVDLDPAQYETCYTYTNLVEDTIYDLYVTFTKYAGDSESEPVTKVYDGEPAVYPVELTGWEEVYDYEVRYALDPDAPDEEWLNEADFLAQYANDPDQTKVGEHTYYYRVFAYQPGYGDTYADYGWVWVNTGCNGSDTVTITPRPLTITANSFKIDYASQAPVRTDDGHTFLDTEPLWHGYQVEGLIEGDEVNTNGTIMIRCPSYQQAIGQYALIPTNATGVADSAIDPSGNYSLEYRIGVLSIEKSPMVIGDVIQFNELDPEDPLVNTGVKPVLKPYDGEATNLVVDVQVPVSPSDYRIQYSTDDGRTWTDELPAFTHAGTNKVWYSVTSGTSWEDSNYFWVTNYNYVIITPREIELTSATAVKMYDGEPLVTNLVELTDGAFFGGDSFTYRTTASQTDVGTTDNTFDYTLVSGDGSGLAANDYTVTIKEGTLTVTPAQITIGDVTYPDDPNPIYRPEYGHTGVDDVEIVYDGTGTNIVVNVVKPTEGATIHYTTTPNDPGSWVEELLFTNVCDQVVYFAVDAPNYASATNFAKVTILPRQVTVKADDAMIKAGEREPGYTVTIDGLAPCDEDRAEELIAFTGPTCPTYATISGTEGTYEDVILVSGAQNQGNYTVTYQPGDLVVIDYDPPEPLIAEFTLSVDNGTLQTMRIWAPNVESGDIIYLAGAATFADAKAGKWTPLVNSSNDVATLTFGADHICAFPDIALTTSEKARAFRFFRPYILSKYGPVCPGRKYVGIVDVAVDDYGETAAGVPFVRCLSETPFDELAGYAADIPLTELVQTNTLRGSDNAMAADKYYTLPKGNDDVVNWYYLAQDGTWTGIPDAATAAMPVPACSNVLVRGTGFSIKREEKFVTDGSVIRLHGQVSETPAEWPSASVDLVMLSNGLPEDLDLNDKVHGVPGDAGASITYMTQSDYTYVLSYDGDIGWYYKKAAMVNGRRTQQKIASPLIEKGRVFWFKTGTSPATPVAGR